MKEAKELRSQLNTPRPSSQNKGDLFAPRGTEGRDKGQRQEIQDKGEGKEKRREGRKWARKRGEVFVGGKVCKMGNLG